MTSPDAIEIAFNGTIKDNHILKLFAKAMWQLDAQLWKDSTDAEIQALLDNGTWEVAKLSPGEKAIGSQWVFHIKLKSDGSLEKYKSHLVAKGYTQRPGIDYDKVFAPTTRWATLWAILAQGALQGAYIESIDISNAYLNGVLDDDMQIYMQQPEGYHQGGADWVCKLRRGLYGLKQSGRLWDKQLGTALEGLGFRWLQSDPSIYIWMNDNIKVIIPVLVDDLTLVSNSKQELDWIKQELAKVFKQKDLGPITSLLGVEVEYNHSQKDPTTLTKTIYPKDPRVTWHVGLSTCIHSYDPWFESKYSNGTINPRRDRRNAQLTISKCCRCIELPGHCNPSWHLLCHWTPCTIQFEPRPSTLGSCKAPPLLSKGEHRPGTHLRIWSLCQAIPNMDRHRPWRESQ